ncbi:hypothetical protein ACN2C6_18365 [Caulobacter sp. ErkDOM-YI]|uniref:hypothetical protein n=1 Tax=unclassified Caulobacter TaxID=2648921 RepID=UPI003AF4C628
MIGRRETLIGTLALALPLQGCEEVYSYRYRLTLDFVVDGITRSGSSVRSVRFSPPIKAFGNMSAGSFLTRGEAVIVDLGRAGYLFATFGEFWSLERGLSGTNWSPDHVFGRELGKADFADRKAASKLRKRTKRILESAELPILMRFKNLADPTSAYVVDPTSMSAAYGPGVEFRQATVEITRDKVSIGRVEGMLPWSGRYASSGMHLGDELPRGSERRYELYAPISIFLMYPSNYNGFN